MVDHGDVLCGLELMEVLVLVMARIVLVDPEDD